MGNNSSHSQERFYSRYAFIQAQDHKHFGLVKIYRKKEHNFDYAMVFDQHYSSAQAPQIQQKIIEIRNNYTLQGNISLLRILNAQLLPSGMCEARTLRIFMQYLNFTLKDAINQRKEIRKPFTPDELMYIIQTALNAYYFLKKLNANYLSLRPDSIFINVDGVIKLNPVRIDPFPIEAQTCQCTPQNKMMHYQKSQRQILVQLKNLVLQLVEICPQSDFNFRKCYQLLAKINKAKTLEQVKSDLWPTDVDSILLDGKRYDTTDQSSGQSGQDSRANLLSQMGQSSKTSPFSLKSAKLLPGYRQYPS